MMVRVQSRLVVAVMLLLIAAPTRAHADELDGSPSEPVSLELSGRMLTHATANAFDAGSLPKSLGPMAAASIALQEPDEEHLNRVGLFLGATTKTNGNTEFSIGVEYERRFQDLLGAGLVVEWEPSFEERVLVAPALFVHPVGELLITVAPGAQFEENSTDFVFRLGAAWEFELAHGLALAPTINYDFVESAHDAISYGLVLSLSF